MSPAVDPYVSSRSQHLYHKPNRHKAMAGDDTDQPSEEELAEAQDDQFDQFGGEEENEGGDDIEANTEGDGQDGVEADDVEDPSEDPNEALEVNSSPNDEEAEDYEVWRPNDKVHEGPKDQHAIITCSTSAGPLLMHFHRAWAPQGYEKATSLFERHYYDHSHFFRVVPHFLVQFGIGYTTDATLKKFSQSTVPDDPKRSDLLPFKEGMISFAGSGPNSRSSQLFIAYDKAGGLGTSPWETPFGEVVGNESFETIRNFYKEYGDMPPWGKGPEQGPIHNKGSRYIEENFPLLDKFNTCQVRRVAEIPKEQPVVASNVRKSATGVNVKGTDALNSVSTKEQKMPMVKLFLLLGAAVVVILGLGLRKRRKKKVGKSV